MNNISTRVLAQIKEKDLKPKSKLVFAVRNYLAWTALVLVVISAGFASGVAFVWLSDDFSPQRLDSLPHIFEVIPSFWLVLMVLLLLIALIEYRQTKLGYRRSHLISGLVIVGTGVVIGSIFIYSGIIDLVEQNMAVLPYVREMQERRIQQWHRPAVGLLAGKIINVQAPEVFSLKDVSGMIWQVTVGTTTLVWQRNLRPERDLDVKIIGQAVGEGAFVATEIRPGSRGCANQQMDHVPSPCNKILH
ncbi:hypothetical protein HGA64_01460 [Candidatus Falkowbacteria bacterium]|nr:hypothetical protein [Candidatus Falkowbacteria bacterium]